MATAARLFSFWPWPTSSLASRIKPASAYDKAIERMEEIAPKDAELLRLRAETAALLGVSEPDAASATQP